MSNGKPSRQLDRSLRMIRTLEIVVDEAHFIVDVAGQPTSPKMVLLHALGQGRHNWSAVAEHFSASFQVFTPDLGGHRDSSRPGGYSFEVMRNDVIGILDDLGSESVVLVGHSMGGVIAYLIALHRPDLVERLVIEDVSPTYKLDIPTPVTPSDAASLPFDWAIIPAIINEVSAGAPEVGGRPEYARNPPFADFMG